MAVAIILIIAYITLLIGQRRYVIYLLLMSFIIINYRFIRIKLKWLFLTVLLAYSFFFVYPYTRSLWSQVGIIRGITASYNIVAKNPEILLPFASGEFIPPSKVLLEVLTDESFKYQYGASYIGAVIGIIPRAGKALPE